MIGPDPNQAPVIRIVLGAALLGIIILFCIAGSMLK